jgi:hypothetical protein
MGELIYNVTVKVENAIADKWLQWLLQEHAPKMIATDCFTKFITLKLLDQYDADGTTYAIQYFSRDIQDYQRYLKNFEDRFKKEAFDKWGNAFVDFRTLMQVVS